MSEDDWGCLATAVALVVGGYWVFTHYQITEKTDHPAPAPRPSASISYVPPRPTGFIGVSVLPTGEVWSLDADSVTGPRASRQGWLIMDASADKASDYRTGKELVLVNCDTTAERILSTAYYDAKGKIISAESWEPDKAKVDYFAPGTVGASFTRAICAPGFDTPK